MSHKTWITRLKEGDLDPRYIEIMTLVDLVAGDLPDNENRARMYADLRDTFINRLKEIKPRRKLFGISFSLKN